MKIGILTQYYPPEPIPKPHELARGLVERGHEVVVVTVRDPAYFPHLGNSRNPECQWELAADRG